MTLGMYDPSNAVLRRMFRYMHKPCTKQQCIIYESIPDIKQKWLSFRQILRRPKGHLVMDFNLSKYDTHLGGMLWNATGDNVMKYKKWTNSVF